jgi:hypothetical protein
VYYASGGGGYFNASWQASGSTGSADWGTHCTANTGDGSSSGNGGSGIVVLRFPTP